MSITQDLVAFIELQANGPLFTSIVKLACSSAPNPFPTFDFLAGQLIVDVTYAGAGDRILSANEFQSPPGEIAISFPVAIRSIDLAAFIQSPQSPTTTTQATYVVSVSVVGLSLAFTLVQVDVGANQYPLSTPTVLVSQSVAAQLGPLGGTAAITGGAVLYDPANVVAVIRFSTSAASSTIVAAWPLVVRTSTAAFPSGSWAIFISGGALANFVHGVLVTQLADNLPHDIAVSTPPQVEWTQRGFWGIDATVELDAKNACPSVLGDSDIHVTMDAWIVAIGDVPNRALRLRAHVTHDTSQWDVFVCTFKNIVGGLLGIATTSGAAFAGTFFGGFGVAYGAALMLPEIVYSMVDSQFSGQTITGFTAVTPPDPGDDATLTESIALPLLYPGGTVPSGDSIDASVDADGVTIRGTWTGLLPVPGTHAMTVAGNPVECDWDSHFNCNTHHTDIGDLTTSPIVVSDVFTAPGVGSQQSKVQIFNVVAVSQSDWSAAFSNALANFQQITVAPLVDPMAHIGMTGQLFIHCSAGLAAVNIGAIPAQPPQLTGFAWAEAVASCQKAGAPWRGGPNDVHWSVDPGPWEVVADVRHEWAVRLAGFASDTTVQLELAGERATSATFGGNNQAMAIHFVSSPADQLRLTVRGQGTVGGSVGQRLLVVQRSYPVGTSIRSIARASEGNLAILTVNELVTMNTDLRVVSRLANRGGTNLTHTTHGTYLWGPSGAFLLTRSGLRQVVGAAVHAVEIEPAQIVFHSDEGLYAGSTSGVTRVSGVRVRPTAAPVLGAMFLRLSGKLVMLAEGSDLLVAQAGRFSIRTQGPSA